MKIVLIMPNTKKIRRCFPLGLLYICASLKQAGFQDIQIIDAKIQKLTDSKIYRRIKSSAPDVVGISALSMEAPEVRTLANLVKLAAPQCKVVIGGPYATSSPEFIMQDPHIDFVIIGEGERTICNLMHALEKGSGVSDIDGLGFKNDGKPVINLPKTTIEDIDSIPSPAWDLIDMERYFNTLYRHSQNILPASNRIVPLFTSRGCPFGCIYCHNIFGKEVRLRSVNNVITEIKFLIKRYAVGEIEIIDDNFNFDLARAKQICDEIIKQGIRIKLSFPNGLRVDRMDEELIVKLKQAGTHVIFYAIESGSPEVQKRIRKNIDLEKAKKIVYQTAQQGIITAGYFMLGFPGETRDEMLQTVRMAKELPFLVVDFFYVTPHPNTQLFTELKEKHKDFGKHRIFYYHKLSFNATSISDNELIRMQRGALKGFYLRPYQIWRIWKAMPNKEMLLRNTISMLKYLITNKI